MVLGSLAQPIGYQTRRQSQDENRQTPEEEAIPKNSSKRGPYPLGEQS